MARESREKSNSGIYHIMMRGTNRQEIFFDDLDNKHFLDRLNRCKEENYIDVYAWCLMGNHIHLLIKEGSENISKTMQRLGVSYARYYNWKYNAVGHVFQDRFRSENVETDGYLLTVVRYIHQNPVKAGLVKKVSEYKWSSCCGYYGNDKQSYLTEMLNIDFVLGILNDDREKAKKEFIIFNEQVNQDNCLDQSKKGRLTDKEALVEILNVIKGYEIPEIKGLPKPIRCTILRSIKKIEGITLRQAARILGISHVMLHKVR